MALRLRLLKLTFTKVVFVLQKSKAEEKNVQNRKLFIAKVILQIQKNFKEKTKSLITKMKVY